MLIGYVRVSTNDQNTDLQRNALNCAGCELIFEDKISSAMGVRHYNWLLKINKFCIVVMILPSCYKVWILAKLLYVKPITIKKQMNLFLFIIDTIDQRQGIRADGL